MYPLEPGMIHGADLSTDAELSPYSRELWPFVKSQPPVNEGSVRPKGFSGGDHNVVLMGERPDEIYPFASPETTKAIEVWGNLAFPPPPSTRYLLVVSAYRDLPEFEQHRQRAAEIYQTLPDHSGGKPQDWVLALRPTEEGDVDDVRKIVEKLAALARRDTQVKAVGLDLSGSFFADLRKSLSATNFPGLEDTFVANIKTNDPQTLGPLPGVLRADTVIAPPQVAGSAPSSGPGHLLPSGNRGPQTVHGSLPGAQSVQPPPNRRTPR